MSVTKKRLICGSIGLYAIMAIITFGHAAGGHDAWLDRECGTLEQRVKQRGSECYFPSEIAGVFSGVLWPLYWSWEVQS